MYRDKKAMVQPDQYKEEFAALLEIYKEVEPMNVLEIGIREGGTFYQWMKHAKEGANILGIDLPTGRWGERIVADFVGLWNYASKRRITVSVLLGNSHHDMSKRAIKYMMPAVDFLFIDADHTFNGIKEDFEFYSELVVPNGIIAIHDILPDVTDSGIKVYAFWDWIKEDYTYQELFSVENQKTRGIGVIVK